MIGIVVHPPNSHLPLPDPSGFSPSHTGDTVWTPEKTYPFSKSPGGTTRVLWTPLAAKKFGGETVVYQLKRGLKRYIGQTVNLFKRIATHLSHAKHHPDSTLYKDLHDQPEEFELGAIVTSSPDKLETKLIKQKHAITQGYNRRNGGGGGKARRKENISKNAFEQALGRFAQAYQTPKRFSLKRRNGRVTHTVPQDMLHQKERIYRILRKTPLGSHVYVGCTERKVSARLNEHIWHINHRTRKFYKDLYKHAKKCSFSIIPDTLFPPGLSIAVREQIVIEFYLNRGFKLYNSNRGGGGGAAKN